MLLTVISEDISIILVLSFIKKQGVKNFYGKPSNYFHNWKRWPSYLSKRHSKPQDYT